MVDCCASVKQGRFVYVCECLIDDVEVELEAMTIAARGPGWAVYSRVEAGSKATWLALPVHASLLSAAVGKRAITSRYPVDLSAQRWAFNTLLG
jgi:hypothetical protein